MKFVNFEKIVLFLFVASWVNLPGVIYEKWSLDVLTNGHGKNLIPYFLPCLFLFFSYYFVTSDWNHRFKNPIYGVLTMFLNKSNMEDRLLVILIIYMVFLNHIWAIIDSSESNLRMIMPLITAHMFFWLYKRYSYVSKINNVNDFFGQCVFFAILIMLILQLLMFMGIVPGLTDLYDADSQRKIVGFLQINGKHIATTSFMALILMFLLLFYEIKLPRYVIAVGYVIIFLVLIINQVRGALLPLAALLVLYFCSKLTIRNVTILGVLTALVISLYFNNLDHRVFSFDSSANERLLLMNKTFEAFLEHPIFGRGSYFIQNLRFGFTTKFVVHNYYLRFLTAYGIVGFLIFLCYLQPLFLRKLRYKYLVGLFVVFSIASFDAYFIWAFLIIATFHQIEINDQKTIDLGVQTRQLTRASHNE